jgi:hypothetical protein
MAHWGPSSLCSVARFPLASPLLPATPRPSLTRDRPVQRRTARPVALWRRTHAPSGYGRRAPMPLPAWPRPTSASAPRIQLARVGALLRSSATQLRADIGASRHGGDASKNRTQISRWCRNCRRCFQEPHSRRILPRPVSGGHLFRQSFC